MQHRQTMFPMRETDDRKKELNYLMEIRIATTYTTSPWYRLVEKNPYLHIPPARAFTLKKFGDSQTYSYRFYRRLWKIHEFEKIKKKLLGTSYVPF
jgi:hypothetical protein